MIYVWFFLQQPERQVVKVSKKYCYLISCRVSLTSDGREAFSDVENVRKEEATEALKRALRRSIRSNTISNWSTSAKCWTLVRDKREENTGKILRILKNTNANRVCSYLWTSFQKMRPKIFTWIFSCMKTLLRQLRAIGGNLLKKYFCLNAIFHRVRENSQLRYRSSSFRPQWLIWNIVAKKIHI